MIPSSDGEELYSFDGNGRHLRTTDSITGADRYRFEYAPDPATAQCPLRRIFDVDSNMTEILCSGNVVTIRAPGGQETVLRLHSESGFLEQVSYPGGDVVSLGYQTDSPTNGLLTSFTKPGGRTSTFTYDAVGRLSEDRGPLASSQAARGQVLDSSDDGGVSVYTLTSPMGRTSTFVLDLAGPGLSRRQSISPSGATHTVDQLGGGVSTSRSADGTTSRSEVVADERFGIQVPVTALASVTSPSGRSIGGTHARYWGPLRGPGVRTRTDVYAAGRVVDGGVLPVQTVAVEQSPSETELTVTASTQETGRSQHAVFDLARRPTRVEPLPILQAGGPMPQRPIDFEYYRSGVAAGLPKRITRGDRWSAFTYNGSRQVQEVQSPAGATSFTYDAAGRLQTTTVDGVTVRGAVDTTARTQTLTVPPLGAATDPGRPHVFAYNVGDLLACYSPPPVSGTEDTGYTHNADGQLDTVRSACVVPASPTDRRLTFGYDDAGRLQSITRASAPTSPTSLTYVPGTDKVASVTNDGAATSYFYDGPMLTSTQTAWASTSIVGTVERQYDGLWRLQTLKVNGLAVASYDYAADGRLQAAGAMTLARCANTGVVLTTSLPVGSGAISDSRSYNQYGEVTRYEAVHNGPQGAGRLLYRSTAQEVDLQGRVRQRLEEVLRPAEAPADSTVEASTSVYTYDGQGRLKTVTRDGTALADYQYDPNGNRIGDAPGQVYAGHDAQDRLLWYAPPGSSGVYEYAYTPSGSLSTKTWTEGGVSSTTLYTYDELGNLRQVQQPDGHTISYVVDGLNQRIGRLVDGVRQQGWTYLDSLRPLAEHDGAGNVVSHFVYASGGNVPAYLVRTAGADAGTYRLVTDHLGSVRLVVNVATGVVKQATDYDVWGRVLRRVTFADDGSLRRDAQGVAIEADTDPPWQPFGFAGGLYDPATRLVRFGARDLETETGRWTAKDPIRFKGGQTNLYAYVSNDPVGRVDWSGLKVEALYDVGSGSLQIVDLDTGAYAVIGAASGGNPWGDPIPNGSYDILNRGNSQDFFRLDAIDASPRDDVHQPTGRNEFRLHKPGRTVGCIAANDADGWQQTRDILANTSTDRVGGWSGLSWTSLLNPANWFDALFDGLRVPDGFRLFGTLNVVGGPR